eukprot:GILK01000313.1.p1 GENE.GILK01000313.1~~GILK01000313.1.p1  ORF type:complete len:145 (-),score=21.34 GILK01000313.1:259-693(-)
MRSFCAVVVLLAIAAPAYAIDFTNCGTATDPVTITAVTLIPDPAKKGETLNVVVDATSAVGATGGHAQTTVRFLGIKIVDETDDLCELLKAGGQANCPVVPGAFKALKSVPIPSAAPSGTLDAKVEIFNQDNVHLACAQIKIKL